MSHFIGLIHFRLSRWYFSKCDINPTLTRFMVDQEGVVRQQKQRFLIFFLTLETLESES